MTYFTKHTVLPLLDDTKTRVELFYIGNKLQRVVEYNIETNKIEIDTMYQSRIIDDMTTFPITEGEQIFDPYIYYMI
jgi:hypothetical protein